MRSRRHQSGFTIVEIIVVTCIIAVLASVAINSVREYTRRAKMSEAVLALGTCKTVLSESFPVLDSPPVPGNWGCETTTTSYYVDGVQTSSRGVVRLKLRNMDQLDGQYVYLVPARLDGLTPMSAETDLGNGVRSWLCGSDFGLVLKALPSNCRTDMLTFATDTYGP
jgi:type IV pilus assembly protein PilA